MKLILLVVVGMCLQGWDCFSGNSSKNTDESKVMADIASVPQGVPYSAYAIKCDSDTVKITCNFAPVLVKEKTVDVEEQEIVKKVKRVKVVEVTPQ